MLKTQTLGISQNWMKKTRKFLVLCDPYNLVRILQRMEFDNLGFCSNSKLNCFHLTPLRPPTAKKLGDPQKKEKQNEPEVSQLPFRMVF